MPRLSIIIPVVDRAARWEDTLASVLQNRPAKSEVLVCFNSAYDDPYVLRDEVRFIEAPADAGAVDCINHALAVAQAPIVHLLRPGIEALEGWTEPACARFDDPHMASVSPVIVDAANTARVMSAGVSYSHGGRRKLVRKIVDAGGPATASLGPSSAAAFYRRAALSQIGGFCSAVGEELIDVDAALTLQRLGWTTAVECESRVACVHQSRSHVSAFARGLQAERLFWRHASAAGWKRSLAAHPLTVLGDMFRCLPNPSLLLRLAGRLAACCKVGEYARHYLTVDALAGDAPATLPLPAARRSNLRLDDAHSPIAAAESRDARAA